MKINYEYFMVLSNSGIIVYSVVRDEYWEMLVTCCIGQPSKEFVGLFY